MYGQEKYLLVSVRRASNINVYFAVMTVSVTLIATTKDTNIMFYSLHICEVVHRGQPSLTVLTWLFL